MLKEIKGSALWLLFLLVALLIPKPKGKKEVVDSNTLEKLLKDALGNDCHLFLVDWKYKIPTYESMWEFLRRDKTDLYKYIPEWLDCDDFSFRLMGQFSIPGWSDIAFGIATSRSHAYNIVVANNEGLKVYLIEPQTDKMQLAKEMRGDEYKTVFVMM